MGNEITQKEHELRNLLSSDISGLKKVISELDSGIGHRFSTMDAINIKIAHIVNVLENTEKK